MDKKSLETVFLIAIFRPSGDKWQSKTLFLTILYLDLLIVLTLYKYNIFERAIVENIIPRNVIINRGAAEVDNHISRDDFFRLSPSQECYILLY